ncbi:hypothetical protein DPEC_G00286680 [Dallia pectoralis]|uniref:Uncharacterized protein n=1 Tax=Dallia pectoralis TaxID=75939 RepID=A0ACC2FK57_DALPE|nr:hypothetical protein DPEC_G00286680 [Dallia pectoralis]
MTESLMETCLSVQASSNGVQRRKNRRHDKETSFTYLGMIAHAIQGSPDKMLLSCQLMDKLEAFISGDRQAIKNNIRVCLSTYDCFVKVPVGRYVKNNLWKFDDSKITAKMARRHFKGILEEFPELSNKQLYHQQQLYHHPHQKQLYHHHPHQQQLYHHHTHQQQLYHHHQQQQLYHHPHQKQLYHHHPHQQQLYHHHQQQQLYHHHHQQQLYHHHPHQQQLYTVKRKRSLRNFWRFFNLKLWGNLLWCLEEPSWKGS